MSQTNEFDQSPSSQCATFRSDPLANKRLSDESNWVRRLVYNNYTKTFLAVCFYFGNMLFNTVLISIVHERVPVEVNPLSDISFDLVPYWRDGIFVSEYLMATINTMLVLMALFRVSGSRIAQRYFLVAGIVYFLRGISISLTQLPVSGNRFLCEPKMEQNVTIAEFVTTVVHRSLGYVRTAGAQIWTTHHYCGDYLYSGHTVNFVLGKYGHCWTTELIRCSRFDRLLLLDALHDARG